MGLRKMGRERHRLFQFLDRPARVFRCIPTNVEHTLKIGIIGLQIIRWRRFKNRSAHGQLARRLPNLRGGRQPFRNRQRHRRHQLGQRGRAQCQGVTSLDGHAVAESDKPPLRVDD